MAAKRKGEKTVLSRQDIQTRRKVLSEQRMGAAGIGAQAIVAVLLVAAAVMAFLAVATFDPHDRLGPGFRNAVGPVGHALAEMLCGLFGVNAFIVPVAFCYLAVMMVAGDKGKRRWPQLLCLMLLIVCGSVLAQLVFGEEKGWAHAPGGLLGRTVGGVLTALFSTVGTVVLVSALASVALIVGTQFYFLKACSLVYVGLEWLAKKAHAWALTFIADQKKRLAERRALAEEEAAREAAFLAQLDAQEAELQQLEVAAEEADAIAEENARLQRESEETRLQRLAQKEAERQIREAERQQREIERLARQMVKETRAEAKARAQAALPQVTAAAPDPLELDPDTLAPEPSPGDPAWAVTLPSPKRKDGEIQVLAQSVPSDAPPTRRSRVPNIIEPPAAPQPPPPPAEALEAAPPAPPEAAEQKPPPPQGSTALARAEREGALARMPVIVEPKAPPKPTAKKQQEQFEFVGDRRSFAAPPIDILEMNKKERNALDKEQFLQTAEKLRAKLNDFGIVGEVVEIRPGPVVTMYEFLPGPGIKVSKIAALADDLAMAMEAMRVRIVAPIPGKGVVGIEVPNKDRETVFLKEVAEQDAFQKSSSRLTMCLGKDIEGMPYVLDLAKAPHLLIAGTTGSGKSVSVNAMIMSILLKSTPEEVRFIMVDPKMLELSVYEGIPHLLLPVVTDPRKAATALQWAVDEMTRRYKLLAEAGVRNIAGYNALIANDPKKAVVEGKAEVVAPPPVPEAKPTAAPAPAAMAAPAEAAPEEAPSPPKKKRKLLIVDVADGEAAPPATQTPAAPVGEAAMGVPAPAESAPEDPVEKIEIAEVPPEVIAAEVKAAEKEGEIRVEETVEESAALALANATAEVPAAEENERKKLPYIVVIIDELADLMMVASKEVETSVARLAQMARAAGIHLMVATQRPSTDVVTGVIKANFPTRITFMLRSKPDSMTVLGTVGAEALLGMGDMLILPPTSAHLQRVHGCFVSETEIKRAVDHLKAQGKPVYDDSILKPRDEDGDEESEEDDLSDELYDQAVAIVSEMRQVSISMLQRKMRIGYNRSARMIERMERDGIVGAADGAKPRDVLIRPVGQMPAP
jgi:S-DNA-T family DNA segregation ATPase FtsK/SpoIIIE